MAMKPHAVSCLILAGGKSKRMNHADKGLVKFKGQPLIEHVIDALQDQIDDFVISANRNIDTYQQFASTVIPDNDEKNGPLSGIASALTACQHDQVLVVPCDMPFLPDNLVSMLFADFDHNDIAIVEIDQRLQLVMMLKKSLLGSVQKHLSAGNHKLMQWVETCSPAIVNCDDTAAAFRNINSIDDLEQT